MSETKFIKTKKEKNYTTLDNTFIKDTTLSWKAKGLMTYFLSLPDDWVIHLSEVEKHATDGKASLRNAINELKAHGYLKAEQRRVDNRFAEMTYTIIENPAETFPLTDFQETENQKTEKQEAENQPLQNTNNNKVLKKQNTNTNSDKPKGQHKEVYDKYLENHTKLYEQGKLRTDKATINYTVTGTLIKNLLKTYTLEEILFVIDRAVSDKWVVEHGYSLSLILSAGQINKLLNARPMQKEAPKKKYKYGQFPTVTDAREYIERTKAKEPNWDAQFFHDFFCEWVGAGCPVDSDFDDFYMANKK